MKIALIGRGRMGGAVASELERRGLDATLRLNGSNNARFEGLHAERLRGIDVCIDFSTPEVVLGNIQRVTASGVDMVVGTTGWYEELGRVSHWVEKAGTGLVYAANYCTGMNLLFLLARRAARLFSRFEEFDYFVEAAHHRFKSDSPSGTALALSEALETGHADRAVPIFSSKAGYTRGRHVAIFDAPDEVVRLEHEARSRRAYAQGAVQAAGWIHGRKGLFSFRELIEEKLENLAS